MPGSPRGIVRDVALGNPDVIAMLDVLHYIDIPAQDALLDRIRAALPPGLGVPDPRRRRRGWPALPLLAAR